MLVTIICEYCHTMVSGYRTNKATFRFCSVPCSNKGRILNRVVKTKCFCGGKKNSRAKMCNTCTLAKQREVTLQELRDKYDINNYHSVIRGYARRDYVGIKKCFSCGYSLHVDICHIKDVQDFPLSATLAQVNAIDNLVALCKNHHWEFDNGYLLLESTQ